MDSQHQHHSTIFNLMTGIPNIVFRVPRILNARRFRKHFFTLCCTVLTMMTIMTRTHMWCRERHRVVTERAVRFQDITNQVQQLFSLREDERTLDTSGEFIIHMNVNDDLMMRTKQSTSRDVTLLTHCSVEALVYLPVLERTWEGPVSVSVFVEDQKVFNDIVRAFAICNVGLLHKVLFHVVYPVKSIPNTTIRARFDEVMRDLEEMRSNPSAFCDRIKLLFEHLRDDVGNYADNSESYPGNLLRNVAMDGSPSDLVMHIDIDMVPSRGMHALLNQFASTQSPDIFNDTVYVTPSFEVEENTFETTDLPISQSDLTALVNSNHARPFYLELCERCQSATDYKRWLAHKKTARLQVIYNATWERSYEPFYLANRHHIARFDESFRRYGYDRASQSCELHVSGARFGVLDSAFLLHRGYKRRSSLSKGRLGDRRSNQRVYTNFLSKLRGKYPNSIRNCRDSPVFIL